MRVVATFLWVFFFAGCFRAPKEESCLERGSCECTRSADCASGRECVNGQCIVIPDAGQPGAMGWPCTSDSECRYGPCLARGPGNGAVCSSRCDGDAGFVCARGWECKASLPHAALICVPPLRSLCLPCANANDCNAAGDLCLPLDGGAFCGKDCSLSPCPSGFDCRAVGTDAGVARQCVPEALACDCSPSTVGLTRSCHRDSALARCFGVETCRADGGWSGCDAPSASREVCDGVDNDCDGLTDQSDPDLDVSQVPGYPNCQKGIACTGKLYCGRPLDGGAATFVCSATEPGAERCNGFDDDCDGLIDEDFQDSAGRFTSPLGCGSCNNDCTRTVPHLADAGAASVACVERSGALVCAPLACAPGYFPSPPGAPSECKRAQPTQCRACASDSDCEVPGDVCGSTGSDTGKFCLQSCADTSPHAGCPSGSTCEVVSGQKRCMPQGGSCLCSPAKAGFVRSCLSSAASAVCVGEQVCQADGGFTSCDTSQVSKEVCDGLDNNCDGQIDESFKTAGAYINDEHCGQCNTNCTAQWSPTVQHAIGGCIPLGSPTCAIVACTSVSSPGGRGCRNAADCTAGFSCDPVLHHCVRACSVSTDCTAGQSCSGGRCARNCTVDAECMSANGFESRCSAGGICATTFQFKDTDGEPTNGCECAEFVGWNDDPEIFDTYPTAGAAYIDIDCDGIDGNASKSLFVWAQSTQSVGTRTKPFRTIAEALAAFDVSKHRDILVAQGLYFERVVMRDGPRLYGGYSADFSKRDVVTYPTLIEAPEPDPNQADARKGTVNIENVRGGMIAGFTVRGYDVTARSASGMAAANSHAVFVINSPGVVIRNNLIVGGKGGDASEGVAGTAGESGRSGTAGYPAKECQSASCAGEQQVGPPGGTNPSCPAADGNAGASVQPTADPQGYSAPLGFNGKGGSNGVYRHTSPTQAAYCKYDCSLGGFMDGLPAQNGTDGMTAGAGAGCANPLGTIVGGDWTAGAGTSGNNGSLGRGAGGGGAGGCVTNQTPATCSIGQRRGDLGATGGGGGAGGCGGVRGFGAGSGGASFGIFVVTSFGSFPPVLGNWVLPGFGGAGGRGGAGGYGGLGGSGGVGGASSSIAWCAGRGGAGGRGGNGGAGSGGGGGCGGSAFGIAGVGILNAAYGAQNTVALPPLNAAGAGGLSGNSPAGGASPTGNGAPGVVAAVQSF